MDTTTGTRKSLGLTYGQTVTVLWGPQTFTGVVTERTGGNGWTLTLPSDVMILAVVVVVLAGIYSQVKDLNDHLDTPTQTRTLQ